jgi:hypothetical protein
MIANRPSVKKVYPVGDNGLRHLPDYLDANELCQREHLFIYDPFSPGLSVNRYPMSTVTYSVLSGGFILDKAHKIEQLSKSGEATLLKNNLLTLSTIFWPVAEATFFRLWSVQQRDLGPKTQITPNMGMTINPPKRKPGAPRVSAPPTPPKPGGR